MWVCGCAGVREGPRGMPGKEVKETFFWHDEEGVSEKRKKTLLPSPEGVNTRSCTLRYPLYLQRHIKICILHLSLNVPN